MIFSLKWGTSLFYPLAHALELGGSFEYVDFILKKKEAIQCLFSLFMFDKIISDNNTISA